MLILKFKTKRQNNTFLYLMVSTLITVLLTYLQSAFMLASPLIFSTALVISNRAYSRFHYNLIFLPLLFYIIYFWVSIPFYLPLGQLEDFYLKYPSFKFLTSIMGCFFAISIVLITVKFTFRNVRFSIIQVLLTGVLSFLSISILTILFKGNTHDAIENFWSIILVYQTSMTVVVVSSLKPKPIAA